MAKRRKHLNHAPIAEAILDFAVEPRPDLELQQLKSVAETLVSRFPAQSAIQSGTVGLLHGPDIGTQPWLRQQPSGFLLRSEQGTVAQMRLDGFTYSKLAPYTTWQEIADEAIELWAKYVRAASPLRLTRLATRYINDMRLPQGQPSQYLTNPPKLARAIPQVAREFLSRVVIWDQQLGISGIVTQAMGPQSQTESLRLILDVDVFREAELTIELSACRQVLDSLRKLKNEIFFASLTEKAVEHFL